MNDFTKEELKLLGGCIFSKFVASLYDPSIEHLQTDLKNIRDKIETMIENYCEHDYQACLGVTNINLCRNCLRIK